MSESAAEEVYSREIRVQMDSDPGWVACQWVGQDLALPGLRSAEAKPPRQKRVPTNPHCGCPLAS